MIALAPASTRAEGRPSETALVAIGLAALTLVYAFACYRVAAGSHLWMDEVLAVSTARLPTVGDVWAAIWRGAEFSPPTYDILLHPIVGAAEGPDIRLLARIPSILAVFGAAVCASLLTARHLSRTAALVAFGAVLAGNLFEYAVQSRPYALIAVALAVALLLWDAMATTRRRRSCAIALWCALAACVSLHFYGFLAAATVGTAEALWLLTHREVRLRVWVPLLGSAVVLAAWSPLAAHLATFNTADTLSAAYYAKPTVARFSEALFSVLIGGRLGALAIAIVFALVFLLGIADRGSQPIPGAARPAHPTAPHPITAYEIVIIALGCLPLLAFALSCLVTKSFSARYMSAAALLPAFLAAYAIERTSKRDVLVVTVLVLLAQMSLQRSFRYDGMADTLSVLKESRQELPVVIGEGLLYIELMEAADAQTRQRLIYLTTSPGEVSPDPTNEHQVERLAAFHPEYRVSSPPAFLAHHPLFYVLSRPRGTVDTTTPSLMTAGSLLRLISERGEATLFLARGGESGSSIPEERQIRSRD